MKKIIFLLIFILVGSSAYSQNFKLLGEININLDSLANTIHYQTIEYYSRDKKLLGKFSSFDLQDVVEPYIKNISNEQRKRVFLIIENDSLSSIIDIYGITKEYSPLPAVILSKSVKGKPTDTLQLTDESNSVNNKKLLDKELEKKAERKYYLPISNDNKSGIKTYFSAGSLIFPQESGTKKWLKNLKRIKIYYLEK